MLIFDKNSPGGWEEMSAETIEDTRIFLFSGAHGVVSSTNQKLASPIYLDLFPGAIENRVGNQSQGTEFCSPGRPASLLPTLDQWFLTPVHS